MAAFRFDLPPVPVRGPRPLPLLGARGNLLRFFGDPVGWLLRQKRDHGDLSAISDGSASLLCAFGPEHNRRLLSDPRLFHNQEEGPFDLPEGSALRRTLSGLTQMNGDLHRRHRRLLQPAFQKSTIDGFLDEMVSITERSLDALPVGLVVDVQEEMSNMVRRVAMRCLFGLDADDSERDLGTLSTRVLGLLLSPATALLPYDLPGLPFRALLRTGEQVEAGALELVRRRRAQAAGGRDMLSIILEARDEQGNGMTDTEVVGQVSTLFVASHETTAETLTFTIFLLSQHPAVLASLLDELQGALRGGAPTVAQLGKLPLLESVIKESMRLLTSTPLLFARVAMDDAELGPISLPRGAAVALSPLVTHRDPDLYPDPLRFRPERWRALDPSPFEYLPFGAGPRMCIGAGFAATALRVILPMILQRYRLSLAHRAQVSRVVRGIILAFRHGLPMLVAPQDRYFRRAERVRGDIHELVDLS